MSAILGDVVAALEQLYPPSLERYGIKRLTSAAQAILSSAAAIPEE